MCGNVPYLAKFLEYFAKIRCKTTPLPISNKVLLVVVQKQLPVLSNKRWLSRRSLPCLGKLDNLSKPSDSRQSGLLVSTPALHRSHQSAVGLTQCGASVHTDAKERR